LAASAGTADAAGAAACAGCGAAAGAGVVWPWFAAWGFGGTGRLICCWAFCGRNTAVSFFLAGSPFDAPSGLLAASALGASVLGASVLGASVLGASALEASVLGASVLCSGAAGFASLLGFAKERTIFS